MLHLREAGAGPPILLLHGWGCHGGFFHSQLEALARDHRVLAPDLPGHGRSADLDVAPTIEAAADACAELVAARGLTNILLVGWSMGAMVGWSMIERHGRSRLCGFVIVDMTARILNDAGWRHGVKDGLDQARSDVFAARLAERWPRMPARLAASLFCEIRAPDAGLLAWATGEIARSDPARLAPIWRSLAAQDARPLLAGFDLPVSIVRGAGSRLYDAAAAAWQAAHLPRAKVATLKNSGHAPHLEEPAAFNALLREFAADACDAPVSRG